MMKSPLQVEWEEKLRQELFEELGYKNIMQVPRLVKIVLNAGIGEGKTDPRQIDNAVKTLTMISGQKAVVTRAKKSIAGFKLRAGNPIGVKVTLRGKLMWHFLYKLIHVVLPRTRDFQGVSVRSFDGQGNFSIGLADQLVFPEISFDEAQFIHGLQVTIVTTAKNDLEAAYLLHKLGMPFNDFEPARKVA